MWGIGRRFVFDPYVMFPFLHFLKLAFSFLRRGTRKRSLSGWCDNCGGCKILSGTAAGVSRGQVSVFFQYLQQMYRYFISTRPSPAVPLIHCCSQCCGSDPGSSAFLIPGSGIQDGKNPGHISDSLVTMFRLKILRFFVTDPDPEIRWLFELGSGAFLIRDGKISLRIQDPGSATYRFNLVVGVAKIKTASHPSALGYSPFSFFPHILKPEHV